MQMIADGKVNKKTRVNVDNYTDCTLDFVFEDERNLFKWLEEEFEILEDTIEEIEKFRLLTTETTKENIIMLLNVVSKDYGSKINELVRAVNKLNNTTYKAENCMTD